MHFSRQKTLKDDHVLFSSPKGAKHEGLNVFYFVFSIFRAFVINFFFQLPILHKP